MKTKIKISLVLIAVLFGVFAFKPLEKKIILIDAGHGGNDPGVTLNDIQEKTIVANIATMIKDQNKNENLEIVLLRDGDQNMELSQRVSIINKLNPSLVISLHVGSSENSNRNGIEAYIASNPKFLEQSKAIAEILIEKVAGNYFLKGEVRQASHYILKRSNCPAVSLDLGYLTNINDRNYITNERGQTEIADKILETLK